MLARAGGASPLRRLRARERETSGRGPRFQIGLAEAGEDLSAARASQLDGRLPARILGRERLAEDHFERSRPR